ncbi:hypothetical protein LWI28_006522 [Acer negundo]|uniref:Uncharacterized protein n=1 Tax=Acer negundo TaxID=4023 RepID=A0AAD5JI51_ACENE|nr:hypothetical protein LWI28_006522 [Acer negundo]
MSIMDLDKMCEKLGYDEHAFYWYVTPGKSIEDGLFKFKVHDDITRMLKELGGERKVTVLFEHFRGVNRRKAPNEGSSVPIEDEEVVAAGFKGLEFDDDFKEPEYMETFEDEEVEVKGGVIFDEPNADIEEHNKEPEVNDA